MTVAASKVDACNRTEDEQVHSCANAETPEDCESSCGLASGHLRLNFLLCPLAPWFADPSPMQQRVQLCTRLPRDYFVTLVFRNISPLVFLSLRPSLDGNHRLAFDPASLGRMLHL